MPLVVVCGLPCSGKSRRAGDLAHHLADECGKEVKVFGDDIGMTERNQTYGCSHQEKTLRAGLKSAVERHLTRERVVILDSLNYIKGFRYELYCVSKHANTTHCLVLCEASPEQVREWNSSRQRGARYDQDVLEALVRRFEAPDPQSRWDQPLIRAQPDDPTPLDDVFAALFSARPPPPNLSTQSQPLSESGFLHDLDRQTQAIVRCIAEGQRQRVADQLVVPGSTERFQMKRTFSAVELRALRRQFISYTKMHPVDDLESIPTLFVQYLNHSL